jgi:hypothetical protein
VVKNERLVFTDAFTSAWEPSPKPFMTVILTFEDEGGKTKYTARVRHWTESHREAREKMGFIPAGRSVQNSSLKLRKTFDGSRATRWQDVHMPDMFLKDVQHHEGDDNYTRAIDAMKRAGMEYPQILHMFSFKMKATVHLERFTQEIMREPGPLSPGFRELIAAYTSHLNQCPF